MFVYANEGMLNVILGNLNLQLNVVVVNLLSQLCLAYRPEQ